ncbi:MAG: hypothetical protein ACRDKH_05935 [Solirubrobacterales bacterium]
MCAALVAGLALPVAGQATVTIGSDLNRQPTNAANRVLTVAIESLPPAIRMPEGVHSPVNGTVTAWRIRTSPTGLPAPTSLKVVRPLGAGTFTGAGAAPPVVPTPGVISAFAAQLPISIGDRIGIDCLCSPTASGSYFLNDETARALFWQPLLVDGGPGRAPGGPDFPDADLDAELALQADIEPTSVVEIEKIKRRKNGKLRLTVNLPNPGTLVAGDKRDSKTGASAAAKEAGKKKKLLKRETIEVGAPGEVTFTLKATKTARKRLKAKSARTGKRKVKIKAKLRLAFTPAFGTTPGIETEKTKLKR